MPAARPCSGRIARNAESPAAMTSTVASTKGLIAPHGGSLVDLRVLAEQREAIRGVRPVAGDIAEADDVVHAAAVERGKHGAQRLEISVEVADHRELVCTCDRSHALAQFRGEKFGVTILHAGMIQDLTLALQMSGR